MHKNILKGLLLLKLPNRGTGIEHCYLRNCRLKSRFIRGKELGSVYSKNVLRMAIPFPQEIYCTVASHLTRNKTDFSLIPIMKLDSLAWVWRGWKLEQGFRNSGENWVDSSRKILILLTTWTCIQMGKATKWEIWICIASFLDMLSLLQQNLLSGNRKLKYFSSNSHAGTLFV